MFWVEYAFRSLVVCERWRVAFQTLTAMKYDNWRFKIYENFFKKKTGGKMKKLGYFAFLTILIFIVSCESPMKIQINELDNIIGSDFNRSVLKEGGDFSVGYYNGKITTSKVELSWSQTTEDHFAFYKLTRNNAELAVFNDISVISFQDTLVNENSYYDYQITVFAENGMVAKDTIEIKTPLWESPSNLIVNGLSTTDVELTWTDNSESEDNFKIYFYDNTERSLLDSFIVEANITENIVTDLDPTAIYSFEVKAVNQWEEDSPLSTTEWFDMTDFVFDPPSNLNCSQNSDMSIELNWQDNSTLETGFSIERKINSGNYDEIAEIVETSLESYIDIDTTAYEIGDTLAYRVRAFNDYETLEYTNFSNEFEIVIVEIGENQITITVQVDSYPGEASWNVYSYDTGLFYFDDNQTFSNSNQIVTEVINLLPGIYAVQCFDTYGDGGIAGVVLENGNTLISWNYYDYSSFGIFDFQVGN